MLSQKGCKVERAILSRKVGSDGRLTINLDPCVLCELQIRRLKRTQATPVLELSHIIDEKRVTLLYTTHLPTLTNLLPIACPLGAGAAIVISQAKPGSTFEIRITRDALPGTTGSTFSR